VKTGTQRLAEALCVSLTCAAGAWAQIHPSEPAVNLGDTSFLDAVGGPGLVVEEIGDGTHSGKIADGSGHATAASINSVSGLTHMAWLSELRIFHAWYGVEVVGVVAHVDVDTGSVAGLGSLTVSPLILQWGETKIGRVRVQQRAVFDFDLPAGEYRRDSSVNLSSHVFTVHPYYAITAYPAKHLETSWRVHYLWNSTNDTPPLATGSRSTQAGQAVHFNASVGYRLPHGLWVGANGYFLKQVTAPRIDGAPLRDSPEQVGAIGPGAVWDLKRILLYADAYHELGAENRPKGNKVVLRIEWILSERKKGKQL
jgi:hypothetical protein